MTELPRPWLASCRPGWWLPTGIAVVFGLGLIFWISRGPGFHLTPRVPGTDQPPGGEGASAGNPVLAGRLIPGPGRPAELPGLWPGFRGPTRDGTGVDAKNLFRAWPTSGPRRLWHVDLGEGYAGAAVRNGRVYIIDYDQAKKEDALRCLSLADGAEIWRFVYPVPVKRNHGMSRTVPTVTDDFVVAMGPKCHVVCLDARTGELKWGLDLVHQFGTTVPPWYAGQCPLIDGDRVILAPGGKDALVMAVALADGKVLWQSPNPKGWKMTHASVVAMNLGARKTYVYCASLGVVGVAADDGTLLWETSDWKISIATVPSPVVLPENRVFLSGGYNAGSLMLQVTETQGKYTPKALFRLDPETFGATQQTPIHADGHIYGVRPDGRLTCLGLDGKIVWLSEAGQQFGLGAFLLADGLLYVLNDSGRMSLVEASPARFQLLAQAQVLEGRESWGPLALAGNRLLARDLTRMVCLEVGSP